MEDNKISKTETESQGQGYSYTPNHSYGYTPNTEFKPEGSTPPQKPKKNFGLATVILCIILSAAIGAGTVAILLGNHPGNADKNNSSQLSSVATGSDNSNDVTSNGTISNIIVSENVESIVEAVYEKSADSVVGIRTKASVQNFFGGSHESTGEGSGVIYTTDGFIITNYHVIADVVNTHSESSSVEVFLMSDPDEAIDAKIIGYNVSADLAVIKIEKKNLPAVEIANSDEVKVGQYAIAIGCPGGIEFLNSVSYGIISGLNRTITIDSIGEMELIQTDAAINPGNSGGALLNSKGQLIGINSSKLVDESFEGMGFAIPINTALNVVKEIIENKDNPSPYIGIEIYKFDSEYLAQYGLPAGAAVKSVVSNAPAYNAGIKSGDIITSFNKKEIKEYQDFIDILEECTPGTKVTAKIYRNGRYYSTTVTIGSNNNHG